MKIEYKGGLKFEINSGGHIIISDQPKENGGNNEGATPGELFVASLASCIGFYVVSYCKNAGIDASGLKITADYDHAPDKPARIGTITIDVDLPAKVEDNRKPALMNAAKHCFIHNTIDNPPKIEIKVNTAK